MSDKKHQKSIEELCRSRISRTAGGEKWPSLSEKSSHNIMPRSPSPRESYSRRCPDAATRHSLLSGRPLSTDLRTCPKQSVHGAAVEKRKVYPGVQEPVKKTYFPGISPQVVTYADPPFPATDTQPLPPINIPKGHEYVPNTLKQGQFKSNLRSNIKKKMRPIDSVLVQVMLKARELILYNNSLERSNLIGCKPSVIKV